MTPLFKKLNFKDHAQVVVLNAPETFHVEMTAMEPFTTIRPDFDGHHPSGFVLAFAMTQATVDQIAVNFAEKTTGDAVLWIAYPKGSSKKYTCDFNRDTGWDIIGKMGFEPVRQVAIDDDWSALRFRRTDFIKTMTRSSALTETGKSRIKPHPAPLTVPEDLATALHNAPDAQTFFNTLAPSHKKEYIRWIEEAKRPETRNDRVAKTVELLKKQIDVRLIRFTIPRVLST